MYQLNRPKWQIKNPGKFAGVINYFQVIIGQLLKSGGLLQSVIADRM
jgi:hypothetical protein